MGVGTLKPASLISSKDSSIRMISKIMEKGTDAREATIANNNSVGMNS